MFHLKNLEQLSNPKKLDQINTCVCEVIDMSYLKPYLFYQYSPRNSSLIPSNQCNSKNISSMQIQPISLLSNFTHISLKDVIFIVIVLSQGKASRLLLISEKERSMENFNMSKDHGCLQHSQNYVNINNVPVQFSKKNVCFALSCHSMITEKVIKNVDKISSNKTMF